MSHGLFHGKSIEEIVEIRFKEWEIRKAREAEEREELRKAMEKNKADVTEAKPSTPSPTAKVEPLLQKWKHKLHLD